MPWDNTFFFIVIIYLMVMMRIKEEKLKEPEVKRVVERYFQMKGRKTIKGRGAGPDFFEDGKAIEVKGVNPFTERTIKQLCDYALKYAALILVIPVTSLDCVNLMRLYILSIGIRNTTSKFVQVILIAKLGENKYKVREFYDGNRVLYETLSMIDKWDIWESPLLQDKIDEIEATTSFTDVSVKEALGHIIDKSSESTSVVF